MIHSQSPGNANAGPLLSLIQKSILACILLANSCNAWAEEEHLPKLELGAGLVVLDIADYLGADERSVYFLPLPDIVYRGDLFQADEDGFHGILFDNRRLELKISAGGSLPVNSDRNSARENMVDLKLSFELGPSLQYNLLPDDDKTILQLRLNSRALFSVDFPQAHYQGWLLIPELRWERWHTDSWRTTLSLQSRYGDEDYHDWFYGVAPEFALSDRPVYQGKSGFGGYSLAWSNFYSFGDWRTRFGISHHFLKGAAFRDSPLFKRDSATYFSVSLSKMFYRSE